MVNFALFHAVVIIWVRKNALASTFHKPKSDGARGLISNVPLTEREREREREREERPLNIRQLFLIATK
jgi:hypothetical protein